MAIAPIVDDLEALLELSTPCRAKAEVRSPPGVRCAIVIGTVRRSGHLFRLVSNGPTKAGPVRMVGSHANDVTRLHEQLSQPIGGPRTRRAKSTFANMSHEIRTRSMRSRTGPYILGKSV